MSTMKIKFISKGFRAVLLSDGVKSTVTSAGTAIQSRANASVDAGSTGFSCRTWQGTYGGGRWIASVTSTDRAAARAESEDKALSKAVGG